jgi:hypothetical protein
MVQPFFAAILGAILGLKRTCPRCRRDQLVPREHKDRVVKCKFCGSNIPPRK